MWSEEVDTMVWLIRPLGGTPDGVVSTHLKLVVLRQ
jgi:hypothetical protein